MAYGQLNFGGRERNREDYREQNYSDFSTPLSGLFSLLSTELALCF